MDGSKNVLDVKVNPISQANPSVVNCVPMEKHVRDNALNDVTELLSAARSVTAKQSDSTGAMDIMPQAMIWLMTLMKF